MHRIATTFFFLSAFLPATQSLHGASRELTSRQRWIHRCRRRGQIYQGSTGWRRIRSRCHVSRGRIAAAS